MNNVIGHSNRSIPTTVIPTTGDVVISTLGRLRTIAIRIEPHAQAALLLAVRIVYGWFFIQTGCGKWTNFQRTVDFFTSLHLPSPGLTAALVASTELVGGILLAIGGATRYASAVLVVVLCTAFVTAHAADAFTSLSAFTEQPPYPFLVATLILLVFGGGPLSFDRWMQWMRRRAAQYPTIAESIR